MRGERAGSRRALAADRPGPLSAGSALSATLLHAAAGRSVPRFLSTDRGYATHAPIVHGLVTGQRTRPLDDIPAQGGNPDDRLRCPRATGTGRASTCLAPARAPQVRRESAAQGACTSRSGHGGRAMRAPGVGGLSLNASAGTRQAEAEPHADRSVPATRSAVVAVPAGRTSMAMRSSAPSCVVRHRIGARRAHTGKVGALPDHVVRPMSEPMPEKWEEELDGYNDEVQAGPTQHEPRAQGGSGQGP